MNHSQPVSPIYPFERATLEEAKGTKGARDERSEGMNELRLTRCGGKPLVFTGALIVEQAFTIKEDLYLDSRGRLKAQDWTLTMALYRTADGRTIYHARSNPPVMGVRTIGKEIAESERLQCLEAMETMRHMELFRAGPLRLGLMETGQTDKRQEAPGRPQA